MQTFLTYLIKYEPFCYSCTKEQLFKWLWRWGGLRLDSFNHVKMVDFIVIHWFSQSIYNCATFTLGWPFKNFESTVHSVLFITQRHLPFIQCKKVCKILVFTRWTSCIQWNENKTALYINGMCLQFYLCENIFF